MTTVQRRPRRRRWVGLQKPPHDYQDDGTEIDPVQPVGKRGRCLDCQMPWPHQVHQPQPARKQRHGGSTVDLDEAARQERRRMGERDDEDVA